VPRAQSAVIGHALVDEPSFNKDAARKNKVLGKKWEEDVASFAGHFDGHTEALKQSTWHRPMQHVQGPSVSPWTLPSGDYFMLCIAPAAAMETINKTMMQHIPSLLDFLMAIVMWRYYTTSIARWWRFVVFIEATKRHHRLGQALTLILPIGHAYP
jgi:hypothetical protein